MTLTDYQYHALRTAKRTKSKERKMVQTLGLCGEAGEFAERIKKMMWHSKPFSKEEACEELGDVLWYISDLADAFGLSLDEVAVGNIRKLQKRYPNGFTADGGIR